MDDDLYLLRAPVAYFLPAAAMAKIFGIASADRLLWLWTVIGVMLFFCCCRCVKTGHYDSSSVY
ncbi:MAG: hypothetical protein IPP41_00685 [Rhodocyclaceae bacterium]|nr:hypothetical protein [Rhodocyclaceae bacterium]